ncbi:NHL repeat containing protein [Hyphomicrobium denitrificans 1NES1]|uniref:NHL repeat containing protein n=1 Tax=Hyphomicrobium denitrificans 1NES1 TaxID=670307 RepID=N0B7Z3_9HYPH|nr:PQQ-dependent sugar dehydrogenase [Hyphomicrobium denitrificans]AGK56656.1 NHL repeat containing protein [Hyphomicrobium denitrificans 1NES1]
MAKKFVIGVALAAAFSFATISIAAGEDPRPEGKAAANAALCPADNGGLILPRGFCATVFADVEGAPRHIAVAADGTVYLNAAIRHSKAADGPVVGLKDTDGDGRADIVVRFGGDVPGGTGIFLYKDWLYLESRGRIIRYPRKDGEVALQGQPETIVKDLPMDGNHTARPFAIDTEGNLFIDLGSATNSCQQNDRTKESPGLDPCEELKTRAGIWRYDANKTDQVFSENERFVTGIRNAIGIDVDSSGRVYATQHGRDQLYENWPKLYNSAQGSDLPAEELVLLRDGGDYGWPYCYFDGAQGKLVLAPEYGGDGGKAIGQCADKLPPVAAFPAHWGPNDLKIYKGTQFPDAYRGGAFIAFHGSWNRSFGPQAGYNVVFQPLADGKAVGGYMIFADGFRSGKDGVEHRPTGLAIGPDGSLYVADDAAGRVWRITYRG